MNSVILTLVHSIGWLCKGLGESYEVRKRVRIHFHSSSIFFLLIPNLHIFTRHRTRGAGSWRGNKIQASLISISAPRADRVNTRTQALGSALAEGAQNSGCPIPCLSPQPSFINFCFVGAEAYWLHTSHLASQAPV